MMETKTAPYDVAEFLETPEELAAYLEACINESEGDAAFIAKTLGDTAHAKGMSKIAREAGLSRESLYKAFSGDRSPSFDTLLKVVSALGLKLSASVKEATIVQNAAEIACVLLVHLRAQRQMHPWMWITAGAARRKQRSLQGAPLAGIAIADRSSGDSLASPHLDA
jgi:probable addiction module antidote protein